MQQGIEGLRQERHFIIEANTVIQELIAETSVALVSSRSIGLPSGTGVAFPVGCPCGNDSRGMTHDIVDSGRQEQDQRRQKCSPCFLRYALNTHEMTLSPAIAFVKTPASRRLSLT